MIPADETDPQGPESRKPEPAEARAQASSSSSDYYEQLLRLKAEFENFRKRSDKEKPELIKLGRAEVVSKLLPLYDLLVHVKAGIDALASAPETPAAGQARLPGGREALAAGIAGIFKEFEKIFKEEGVRAMEPLGAPLDPMHHEALGALETDRVPEGHVAEVLQPGFLFKEKVLRPAKVRIAKSPSSNGKNPNSKNDKDTMEEQS